MAWFQEWFGEEYLELYSYRDATKAREQVTLFRMQCGPVTGRHIHELEGAGYRSVGCDLSFTLLRCGIIESGQMPVVREMARVLKRDTIRSRYQERVRGYDLEEIMEMFTTCGLPIRSAFGDFKGAKFEVRGR